MCPLVSSLGLLLALPGAGAGTITCWGDDAEGQSTVPNGLGLIAEVSAGGAHTCARTASGLRCWGRKTDSQSAVPSNLGEVVQVSAGAEHTCAVSANGALRCWGDDAAGQSSVPGDLEPMAQAAAGGHFTCACTLDGRVSCWGLAESGGSPPSNLGPTRHVSAGEDFACALCDDGTVTCWGSNTSGQLAVPSGLGPALQVSAGAHHACARAADRSVVCWPPSHAPPLDLGAVADLSLGQDYGCAVTDEGAVRCWGSDAEGLLNTSGLGPLSRLSAGRHHACALAMPVPATANIGTTATASALAKVHVQTRLRSLNHTALEQKQNEAVKMAIKAAAETSLAWCVGFPLTRVQLHTTYHRQLDGSVLLLTEVTATTDVARALQGAEAMLAPKLELSFAELQNAADVTEHGRSIGVTVTIVVKEVWSVPSAMDEPVGVMRALVVVTAVSALSLAAVSWWFVRRHRRGPRGNGPESPAGQGEGAPERADGEGEGRTYRILISAHFTTDELREHAGRLKRTLRSWSPEFNVVLDVEAEDAMASVAGCEAMVALVTDDYAEEGSLSYWQLKHFQSLRSSGGGAEGFDLIPVRLCRTWPPEPRGESAKELCREAFADIKPIDRADHRFDLSFVSDEIASKLLSTSDAAPPRGALDATLGALPVF